MSLAKWWLGTGSDLANAMTIGRWSKPSRVDNQNLPGASLRSRIAIRSEEYIRVLEDTGVIRA